MFFHSSEVADNLALKPGDEISFGLWDNPKTKEVNARRVVRTKVNGVLARIAGTAMAALSASNVECITNVLQLQTLNPKLLKSLTS